MGAGGVGLGRTRHDGRGLSLESSWAMTTVSAPRQALSLMPLTSRPTSSGPPTKGWGTLVHRRKGSVLELGGEHSLAMRVGTSPLERPFERWDRSGRGPNSRSLHTPRSDGARSHGAVHRRDGFFDKPRQSCLRSASSRPPARAGPGPGRAAHWFTKVLVAGTLIS